MPTLSEIWKLPFAWIIGGVALAAYFLANKGKNWRFDNSPEHRP